MLKALPFDERNHRDFEEMTQRIRGALDLIRTSRSLKPTQSTLAKLAGCSRRTLSLRGWPIVELKRIKTQRNPDGHKSESVGPTNKTAGTNQNEAQLIAQIRNYQKQNGRLFDRVQGLEEEKVRATLVQGILEEQVSALTERVGELEKEIRMTTFRLVGAQ